MGDERNSRRARRSGQVRQRRNGKWLVTVFVGRDGAGKRTYRSRVVGGTRKDASRALHEMVAEKERGTLGPPARLTVGEYLDRWLETAARPKVGPRTFEDYSYLINRQLRPGLGGRRLAALPPLAVQAVYERMREAGLSGRTVHVTHNVQRAAL